MISNLEMKPILMTMRISINPQVQVILIIFNLNSKL